MAYDAEAFGLTTQTPAKLRLLIENARQPIWNPQL